MFLRLSWVTKHVKESWTFVGHSLFSAIVQKKKTIGFVLQEPGYTSKNMQPLQQPY